MSSTIVVPKGFEFVGAALLATVFLLHWQSGKVGGYRKKAGIKYPQTYAEKAEMQASKDAYLFNCMQRAHQNTLESIPIIAITTIITGLQYPIPAAAACGAFTLGRIGYTLGYLTGEPAKRHTRGGVLALLATMGLTFASSWVVGNAILSGF